MTGHWRQARNLRETVWFRVEELLSCLALGTPDCPAAWRCFFDKLLSGMHSVILQGNELVRLVNVTRPKYLQSGLPIRSCPQHSLRFPASSRIGISS